MITQPKCGFLILDRKGEYIKDTIDQRGNQCIIGSSVTSVLRGCSLYSYLRDHSIYQGNNEI